MTDGVFILPTIGRIVHVHLGDDVLPGIVMHVAGLTVVCTVFAVERPPFPLAVPHASECPHGDHWRWPPRV